MIPLLSGCQIIFPVQLTATGGGWLPAPGDSPEVVKATFGFTFNMYDITYDEEVLDTYEIKGHLTYIDHSSGIKVIGHISGVVEEGIAGTFGNEGDTFVFIPYDKYDTEGNDYFKISITSGDNAGYTNEGFIGGGSIRVKFKED